MKKIIYGFFASVLMMLTLTSCLKDDKYALDPSQGHNVVEFLNITAPSTGYTSQHLVYTPKAFEAVAEDEFEIGVNWAGPENVASKDITVGIALSPATATAAGYDQLDASLFSGVPSQVVIPKGQRSAKFTVKIKPASFDFSKKNAIAIDIVSTSEGYVSGNIGKAIFSLPVKNLYDGIYRVKGGHVQRYTAPGSPTTGDALNGSLVGNPNVTLVTIDAKTVEITNMRWAGGTSGMAGIDNLRAEITPAGGNEEAVRMFALGNTTVANIAGQPNNYKKDIKTFTINFDWNQTSNKREVTGLVLEYVGPR